MKKSNFDPWNLMTLKDFGSLLSLLLFGCLLCLPVSAQTPPLTPEQQTPSTTPLNLDSDDVAKEMSKEQQSTDTKPDVLSTTQNTFEQSILNSENRKKVSGIVGAGAGVGSMPAQRGLKAENFSCENTFVALNDDVSRNTQIGVSAQVSSCNVK